MVRARILVWLVGVSPLLLLSCRGLEFMARKGCSYGDWLGAERPRWVTGTAGEEECLAPSSAVGWREACEYDAGELRSGRFQARWWPDHETPEEYAAFVEACVVCSMASFARDYPSIDTEDCEGA